MTSSQATKGAAAIVNAPFPPGVDVRTEIVNVERNRYSVHVTLSTCPADAVTFKTTRNITNATLGNLRTAASRMLEDAWAKPATPTQMIKFCNPSPEMSAAMLAEKTEPRPNWQTVALVRIQNLKGVDEGARRLAAKLIQHCEFDDIPAPKVTASGRHVAVIWDLMQEAGAYFEFMTTGERSYEYAGAAPWGMVQPGFVRNGVGLLKPHKMVDPIRQGLGVIFRDGFDGAGELQEMLDLCRVGQRQWEA